MIDLVRMDEYCDSVRDGTHDTPKPTEQGFYLVTSKAINNNEIDFSGCYYISKEDYDKINKRSKVDKWDIVMTMIGSVGRLLLVQEEPVYAIKNTALFKVGNEDRAKWLYYYLSTKDVQNYFEMIASGTSQHFIGLGHLRKLKVADFNKDSKQIIDILYNYDLFIKNNNKRIKILEQMAENLYKEWFVRFRFPGYEDVEFEGGKPKEWIIKSMVDFCYVTDGTHDTPKETESGVPLVTGKSISNGFINFEDTYNISVEDHNKIAKRSGLKSGDILFSNIGTVGNCCIVHYDREFSVKNVIIFKPDTIDKTAYLYYWMNNDTMQSIFKAQTNGASQQFVGLNFMRKYKILIPTNDILSRFSDYVVHIIGEKNKLRQANSNLRKQRDLLLPRLMSGKLQVK